MSKTQRIAILGASGYTGAELIRLLLGHPHAEIKLLTADSQAGREISEVYPHLAFAGLPRLIPLEKAEYKDIDTVFCCLPHGTTQEVIAGLPQHVRIVDLSADFRLGDTALYAKWYGHEHRAPQLQKKAVYGLTEWHRDEIKEARLVANPGCYPTSAALALNPLLAARLVEPDSIIIDAKSGVTGAGRALKQGMLFAEVEGGVHAYGIGAHRHAPEIDQELSRAAGRGVTASFTPHLMPMNRGILSTIYVQLAQGKGLSDLKECLTRRYKTEPFVNIAAENMLPSTHMVRGTNLCVIGAFADRRPDRAILVSVIDNLVKGASGQAVQNMNLMCGYPETTGLMQTALFP